MKIRRDAVAVSCILFTVALVMLIPAMWGVAATPGESGYWLHGTQMTMQNCYAPTGFASLAVIVIGLIVTWTGYIKAVRWTWFVMFVIVWLWAFPVVMLPFFYPGNRQVSFAQAMAYTLAEAIRENGIARDFVEFVLIFLLMVVALVLPVKTFILGGGPGPGRSGRTNLGAPDKRTLAEV